MSAFNGAGTFVISGVGLPYITGTTISSTVANQLNSDLAAGLSNCITKDGQTTVTNNIPMNGFKITGLGVATAPGDALSYGNPATVSDITVTGTLTAAKLPGVPNANKIINGDFMIDQRNAYGLVTAVNPNYITDRWQYFGSVATKFQFQALNIATSAASLGLPFSTWGGYTVAFGAYNTTGNDYFGTAQTIEGYTCTDLLWGTPQAKAATLSFYIYVTVPGDYSVVLRNLPSTHSYLVKFNVPVANVFTKITVPVPGPTVGAWHTGGNGGIIIAFTMDGAGTSLTVPTGAWAAAVLNGAVGQTKMMLSAGAAYALSGVKLEVSDYATPFVPDNPQVAVSKCRRYFRVAVATVTSRFFSTGYCYATANAAFTFQFDQVMRAPPSFLNVGQMQAYLAAGSAINVTLTAPRFSNDGGSVDCIGAGFVAGNATVLSSQPASPSTMLTWDAEL